MNVLKYLKSLKSKNFLKLVILFFVISMSFWNCEKEEDVTQTTNSYNEHSVLFENSFDATKFQQTLPYQYRVDWSNPEKQYSEQLKSPYYEFPIIYTNPFNPNTFNEQRKKAFKDIYKVIALQQQSGDYTFYIVKYFLENIKDNQNVNENILTINLDKGYKGTVHLYNTNNEMVFAKHVTIDENKAIDYFLEVKPYVIKGKKVNQNVAEDWVTVCTTETINHYIEWYYHLFDGNGNLISSTFLYEEFIGTTQEQVCNQVWQPSYYNNDNPYIETCYDNCDNIEVTPQLLCEQGYISNGFGDCEPLTVDDELFDDFVTDYLTADQQAWFNDFFNRNSRNEIKDYLITNLFSELAKSFAALAIEALRDNGEVDFEEQIINELTDKALCVYNKLTSSSTSFKNAIKKFDGEFPVSHLKFEIDKTMSSNTKKAFTRPPEAYVIDIVLNGNLTKDASYQKRPNLLVAKTIIHEVIHAEMFRKLLSLASSNGSIDVNLLNQMLNQGDYPGMLDYYKRHGNIPNSNWQHQQMAAHYRETIARILQEFDTGIVLDNNTLPNQLYLDLAWEGLIYSNITAWQQIMNDAERARIENVISSFISNNLNQTCTE